MMHASPLAIITMRRELAARYATTTRQWLAARNTYRRLHDAPVKNIIALRDAAQRLDQLDRGRASLMRDLKALSDWSDAKLAAQTIFHKTRALRPGDPVAVVAPSGPFDTDSFEAGLAVIAGRYHAQYDPRIFDRHRYLAGSDQRRLEELSGALADPHIRGVFCARGGYGSMRLLNNLRPAEPHKPLVGFSDITALHLWLQTHGRVSMHGPVLTQLGRLSSATHERLFALLESSLPAPPLSGTSTYVEGVAEGPLIGGNLAVLTRLIGTPFMPAMDGAVLVLEDVGERPYRLDRMWTHLALAGVFRRVKGIVLGSFTHSEERDASYTAEDVLRDLAAETGLPCAAGFPIGHGDANEPVPLGVRVRLDAGARQLSFLDAMCHRSEP